MAPRKTTKPRTTSTTTSSSSSPVYCLTTTKDATTTMTSSNVFPRHNNTVQSRQTIRALLRRSRRTVAFAVNHERSTNNLQPSNNMRAVSTSKTTPNFSSSNFDTCDSLSLAEGTTQFTVNNKSISTHTITTNNFTVSQTVKNEKTRNDGVRAISNRDSDYYVKDKSMLNSSNGNGNGSLSRTTTTITDDDNNNNDNKKKKPLSVDVKSTLSITPSASAFLSNGGPVPISPLYNNVETTTTTTTAVAAKPKPTTKTFHATFPTVKRKRGRPSLKSKMLESLASYQTTCVVPASGVKPPSQLPSVPVPPQPQPKIQRVKYDMESVPQVQLNMKIWNAFRNQNQDQNQNQAALPRPIICNSNESSQNDDSSDSTSTNRLLSESVLWTPSSRKEWEDSISEMKSVCTSAAYRRWFKDQTTQAQTQTSSSTAVTNNSNNNNNNNHIFHPPMSQAFIKDRVKYDDPLMGYQIRHASGGWLQGFILYTTMTVWTEDFQWNSTHLKCGLLEDINLNKKNKSLIDDGSLSTELQALKKSRQSDPDPLDGGIVLHGVAEISLLGGLGCGELLLRKAIEDIKSNKKQNYKYIVLEATEGSRSFYEKYGFKRVGAICKYRWIGATTTTSTTTNTNNKNKNSNNAVVDPYIPPPLPPQMQGFRHWTYTNESAKSLKLHGGPSVMMCLKLYDDSEKEENNNSNNASSTAKISELLASHIVKDKPTIKPLGNVSNPNPNGDDLTPTRRSSRGGKVQHQQDNNTASSTMDSMHNAVSSSIGGMPSRRTSSRSKRGRNSALNSDYVVHGSTSAQHQQQHTNRGGNNNGVSNTIVTTATSDNGIENSFERISTAISNINPKKTRYTRKVSVEDIRTSVLSVPPPRPVITQLAPLSHPIIKTNEENNKNSFCRDAIQSSTSTSSPAPPITNNNSSNIKNVMPAINKNKNGCNDDTKSLPPASKSESAHPTSYPMIIGHDNSKNSNTSNDVIIMSSSSKKPASVSLSSSTPVLTPVSAQIESESRQSLPTVGHKLNAPKRDGHGRFITPANQRRKKIPTISSVGVKKNDENSNIVHREEKKVVADPAGTKTGSIAAALAVSTSTSTNVVKIITKNADCVVKKSGRQCRRSSSSPVLKNKNTDTAPSRNTIAKTSAQNTRPDVASATATPKTTASSTSKGKTKAVKSLKGKRKIDAVSSSSSVPSSLSQPNASLWQKQASSFLESDSAGGGGGKRLRQAVISIDTTKLCKQKVKSYPRSRVHYYNKVVVRKRFNAVDAMPNVGRIRRHYNGGSMLDHRYEFCYYFVLHYDEPTQNVTLVPMIRNGLFMSGNKKRMGRYRYQCNILENNKNWILDASPNEYDIVPSAVMIMKTPVVAQEAWDIHGNKEEEEAVVEQN